MGGGWWSEAESCCLSLDLDENEERIICMAWSTSCDFRIIEIIQIQGNLSGEEGQDE